MAFEMLQSKIVRQYPKAQGPRPSETLMYELVCFFCMFSWAGVLLLLLFIIIIIITLGSDDVLWLKSDEV